MGRSNRLRDNHYQAFRTHRRVSHTPSDKAHAHRGFWHDTQSRRDETSPTHKSLQEGTELYRQVLTRRAGLKPSSTNRRDTKTAWALYHAVVVHPYAGSASCVPMRKTACLRTRGALLCRKGLPDHALRARPPARPLHAARSRPCDRDRRHRLSAARLASTRAACSSRTTHFDVVAAARRRERMQRWIASVTDGTRRLRQRRAEWR